MTDESDELEGHVYMHFDGIKKSAEWIVKDYRGNGAFTDAQIEALCQQFQMPRPLIEELSLYVGNSLDSDSEVDLLQVTKSKTIAHANKNIVYFVQTTFSGLDHGNTIIGVADGLLETGIV